jgi:AAA ATPase domain/Bacterial transcriptional activator domain
VLAARSAAAERDGDAAAAAHWSRLRCELDPLDEAAHADLVRQLAACGDRAGALIAGREMTGRLREELGVRPGPLLRAALAEARGPDAAPFPAGPSAAHPLFGRAAELRTLMAAWTAARAGQGRVVLVTGEAGIGKTRLIAELARRADNAGARTAVGAGVDVGSTAPRPARDLAEALAAAGRELSAAELAALPLADRDAAEEAVLDTGLISRVRGGLRFRHTLLAEAVRAGLGEHGRRYEQLALAIEAAAASLGQVAAEVAGHLHRAGRDDLAGPRWQLAARHARLLGAMPEAARFWAEAVRCEPDAAAPRLELAEAFGWLGRDGDFEREWQAALERLPEEQQSVAWNRRAKALRTVVCNPRASLAAYQRAWELLPADAPQPLRMDITLGAAWGESMAGDPARAASLLDEVASLVPGPDDAIVAEMALAEITSLIRLGRFTECEAVAERGGDAARRARRPDVAYGIWIQTACALSGAGHLAGAACAVLGSGLVGWADAERPRRGEHGEGGDRDEDAVAGQLEPDQVGVRLVGDPECVVMLRDPGGRVVHRGQAGDVLAAGGLEPGLHGVGGGAGRPAGGGAPAGLLSCGSDAEQSRAQPGLGQVRACPECRGERDHGGQHPPDEHAAEQGERHRQHGPAGDGQRGQLERTPAPRPDRRAVLPLRDLVPPVRGGAVYRGAHGGEQDERAERAEQPVPRADALRPGEPERAALEFPGHPGHPGEQAGQGGQGQNRRRDDVRRLAGVTEQSPCRAAHAPAAAGRGVCDQAAAEVMRAEPVPLRDAAGEERQRGQQEHGGYAGHRDPVLVPGGPCRPQHGDSGHRTISRPGSPTTRAAGSRR